MSAPTADIVALVKAALAEDIGPGDLTSLACLEPNPVKAQIVAKSDGVLSGLVPLMLTYEIVDSANVVTPKINDGDVYSRGDVVVEIDGFNQTVLASERVGLNFLGRLSGIASLTRQFAERIGDRPCRILDTRKTTPGWRRLEKDAVRHGGGANHRMGLYDMVLIKDNHIASAGSITKAVALTREFLDTPDFRLQFDCKAEDIEIEVEVTSEAELREALEAGVSRLLLDNQSLESLAQLVQIARDRSPGVLLEASGNVTLETVADIAATGVDFISAGALTHSAKAADFSMKVVPD
ncbi:carboxylating nicotinate-nucleotide diphosphorylase [candidate division GN15 bacterium]|nr:carboxylating nicotinate-nucleotide diphosphorylase [candidate division GN15 bacterium]